MVVLAPIPSASVRMTTIANAGFLDSVRNEYFRSLSSLGIYGLLAAFRPLALRAGLHRTRVYADAPHRTPRLRNGNASNPRLRNRTHRTLVCPTGPRPI